MWLALAVAGAAVGTCGLMLARRLLADRRSRQLHVTADTVMRLRRLEDGHR